MIIVVEMGMYGQHPHRGGTTGS